MMHSAFYQPFEFLTHIRFAIKNSKLLWSTCYWFCIIYNELKSQHLLLNSFKRVRSEYSVLSSLRITWL